MDNNPFEAVLSKCEGNVPWIHARSPHPRLHIRPKLCHAARLFILRGAQDGQVATKSSIPLLEEGLIPQHPRPRRDNVLEKDQGMRIAPASTPARLFDCFALPDTDNQ
jgi:hypothetical protein